MVLKDGQAKLVNVKNQDGITKILDMVPEFVNKFSKSDKKSDKKSEEASDNSENEE